MNFRELFKYARALMMSGLVLLAMPLAANAAYPNRPITLIVPWGAGGGTDSVARVVAHGLQERLGKPVNVVNRTGGSGVVGHSAIAHARPNGYTIGMITVELNMMHWEGLTKLTYKDYTILGQVNSDPAAIEVPADAPYDSAKSLLSAIKKKPAGTFKASGTGEGGIWQIALAGLLQDQNMNPKAVTWIPSQGSASGLRKMLAGNVQIVPASIPEARSLIDAGKVKALAVMGNKRNSNFPKVPTLKQAIGTNYTMSTWRGMAAPKGLPPKVSHKLETALKKVYQSDQFQNFMKKRGFGMQWRNAADFKAYLKRNNKQLGDIMKSLGLATD